MTNTKPPDTTTKNADASLHDQPDDTQHHNLEGNEDEEEESEEAKCERLYRAISMRFNDIFSDKIYPYALSQDPKITQEKWQQMFERARRRMATDDKEDDEDNEDESSAEFFQITQNEVAISKGATKGTIEAIVSTAKGAEKKRRRESRNQQRGQNNSEISPLEVAAEIVKGIDELSNKEWKQPYYSREDQPRLKYEKKKMSAVTPPDSEGKMPPGSFERVDAYLDEVYNTPPNFSPVPIDYISECLSDTTATPSPTPQTLISSTSSNTTAHPNASSPSPLANKKILEPFVLVQNKQGNNTIQTEYVRISPSPPSASQAGSPNASHISDSVPSTPLPISTELRSRKRKPALPKHLTNPQCSVIYYHPRLKRPAHLTLRSRLTMDKLIMLCKGVEMKLKRRRAKAGSSSPQPSRSRIKHGVTIKIGESDGQTKPVFLERNLKIGRARRGSLSGRMQK